jgi:hypothetical protein
VPNVAEEKIADSISSGNMTCLRGYGGGCDRMPQRSEGGSGGLLTPTRGSARFRTIDEPDRGDRHSTATASILTWIN